MSPDRGDTSLEATHLTTQVADLQITNGTTLPDLTSTTEPATIPPHLSHDPTTNAKRTDPFQFGQRYLENQDNVFEYNAWDHVAPDDEHLAYSEVQYAAQRAAPVSAFDRERFNAHPERWWDLFYKQKSATFFKDRKWLVQEFPILGDVIRAGAGRKVVLEVGAGAGNTAFPVMRMNENPDLEVVAADFSKSAVGTMREAEDYVAISEGREGRKGKMRAEVWDVAGEELPEGVEEGSADVVIMIFVFSALSPKQWDRAVRNVWRALKSGGEMLFRDYGRGDLAQVRFKAGRWMQENFYVRGDGTRVYFFDKDELAQIWCGGGKSADTDKIQEKKSKELDADGGKDGVPEDGEKGQFEVLNLDVDRRLIVNRQRRIKMYRCWIQGRFQKPMVKR